MNEITFKAAANLTADPELGVTEAGKPFARLSLAINSRRRTPTGEWVDGEPTFLRGVVWGEQASFVAESLSRGQRVVVLGQLVTRRWGPSDNRRSAFEIVVDEIGPSLRWTSAVITSKDKVRQAA